MSIIKDGKQYGVETKTEIKDEFQDKLFSQTLEEINNTTPIKYGRYLFSQQPELRKANVKLDYGAKIYSFAYMFNVCPKLEEVIVDFKLENQMPGIYAYNYMFTSNNNLNYVEINNFVPASGHAAQYMFAKNNLLKKVKITLKRDLAIGEYGCEKMFSNCPSLEEVEFVNDNDFGIANRDGYGFEYCFEGCTSLKRVLNIPNIKNQNFALGTFSHMFDGCSSLEEVTGMKIIDGSNVWNAVYSSAFANCTSLKVTPDIMNYPYLSTVRSYRYMRCFQGCTALEKTTDIALSGNLSNNNNTSYMFANCTSLKEMTWTATTPPTIGSDIWYGCPSDMVIYVPDESVELYKTASVWSSRAAYIKPISEKPA